MRPHVSEIRAAGAELYIVGSGAPQFGEGFQKEFGLDDVTIFCDQALRSYEAAGFRRDVWALIGPRAVKNYARSFLHGAKQTKVQGDPMQQGGVMIVRPDGEVTYRFASRASGDHPKPELLVEKVREAASGRAA